MKNQQSLSSIYLNQPLKKVFCETERVGYPKKVDLFRLVYQFTQKIVTKKIDFNTKTKMFTLKSHETELQPYINTQ